MKVSPQKIDQFISLFLGREDAYGTEDGPCAYVPGARRDKKTQQYDPKDRLPVTRQVWKDHLFGDTSIGIYTCVPSDDVLWCRWSCIDIDFDDYKLACGMREELADVGIAAYVESSRSKGWHVWVFHEDWIEVKYPRALLLWLVTDLGHPKMEVFPKQWELPPDKIGNFVRLPYPRKSSTTGRQRVVDARGNRLGLLSFLNQVETTPQATVERIARRSPHFPSRIKPVHVSDSYRGRSDSSGDNSWMKQDAWKYIDDDREIIHEGGRDNTLHTVARLMAGVGWDIDRMHSTMERIINTQVEGHFSLRVALEKCNRAYNEHQQKVSGYV